MRVFVTGASGWIGSATVDELLAAGHEVTGLARSDASAAALQAKGARVRRGDLDDLASIRAGAEAAEAVIHLANKHDWSNPAASSAAERAAVQTIGDALAGTGRPFLLASGVAGLTQGRPATEDDRVPVPRPGLAAWRQRESRARVRRPRRARREPALRADRARSRRPRVHRDDRRGGPREGRLRLPGRRDQPVGRRAPVRCRAPRRARTREGSGGRPPARRRGRGHTHPRHRGGHRPRLRPARHLDRP